MWSQAPSCAAATIQKGMCLSDFQTSLLFMQYPDQ